MTRDPSATVLQRGWRPGLIGWVAAEHGRYYAREWNFGPVFEAKVAAELGALMLRYDPARDLLLAASDEAGPFGSIAVDGSGADGAGGARLRFFIMADHARGRGAGRLLLVEAMGFAAAAGFERIRLTTFAGLDAARKLYEDAGFRLVHEAEGETWGSRVREQTFEATL